MMKCYNIHRVPPTQHIMQIKCKKLINLPPPGFLENWKKILIMKSADESTAIIHPAQPN